MAFPEWVENQKKRGYEIKEIRGQYYMYKLKSKWDPEKKRSKKVTGEYIGKVTPNGIVPKRRRVDLAAPILSLEHGATAFLADIAGDLLLPLREHFENDDAECVWAAAMLRLIQPCPFKRIEARYESSWMSRILPGLHLSPASITRLLDRVGGDRSACASFMRETMSPSPYVIIDGTGTESRSHGMLRAMSGHSHSHGYRPQVNQVYVLSLSQSGGIPAFYRNTAGNVPDVTAFALTVEDAGIQGATVIGDAGFASGPNFGECLELGLDYVMPLKRNTAEIDLAAVSYEEIFSYHDRAISGHSEERDGYRVCVFRDERMRGDEMSDFVGHKEKANATAEMKKHFDPEKDLVNVSASAAERLASFGTIILKTSVMDGSAQHIYGLYKTRWEIEQLFDTMRNTLGADDSYMRDDVGFEAWTFINHVSLMAACRILSLLRSRKMSKNLSLPGAMDLLSRIHAVCVADEWRLAEIVGQAKKSLSALDMKLDLAKNLLPNS